MATVRLGSTYHRLWSATALSNLGDGIRIAAFPLLTAAITTSPTLVAGAAVAAQLPWLLFGLVAGWVVDRVDQRRLMAAVDIGRTVLLGLLVLTVALGHTSLIAVYAVAFACGVGETLRDIAATTMTPALVDPANLARANGRMVNATVAGNELIGPPLGGYLFGVAVALPFAAGGGTLALSVAFLLMLPSVLTGTSSEPDTSEGIGHEITQGLRWLASHRRLRALGLAGVALSFTDSAWWAILVLYVHQILNLGGTGFGVLMAIGAVGGLAGGFVADRIGTRVGPTAALLAALGVAAAAQLSLGLTTNTALAVAALAVSSFAFAVWNVIGVTLKQTLTPAELRGRVISAFRTLMEGAAPVGALAGGLVAEALGLRAPLLLGVPILVLAAALSYRGLSEDDDRQGPIHRADVQRAGLGHDIDTLTQQRESFVMKTYLPGFLPRR